VIGTGWWSTGITVAWQYSGMGRQGWAATLDYYDDGFCNDNPDKGEVSTEGTLRTRYAVRPGDTSDALTVVIDVLKADAERLGIRWTAGGDGVPSLYYKTDGEDPECPPPLGWRELLRAHAIRLGWRTYDYEPEQGPLAIGEG
jgi:hypothetical protein